jgi:hypothetical protein
VKQRVLATLAVAMLAGIGCGGGGEVIYPPVRLATLPELIGPWRPTPLVLDPALRTRVADVCRRDIELPPGTVPAILDARGEGVVTVRMTGATEGSCDAVEITAQGDVAGAGGGWNMKRDERPAVADTELTDVRRGHIAGGSLGVEGWSVNGQAGASIAVVQVTVADGLVVTATLENGWFSAWWPAVIPDDMGPVDPFPEIVIRAFDPNGALLDSATSDEVN